MAQLKVKASSKPSTQNSKSKNNGNNIKPTTALGRFNHTFFEGSGVNPSIMMAGMSALGLGGAYGVVNKLMPSMRQAAGIPLSAIRSLWGKKKKDSDEDDTGVVSGAIAKNRATEASKGIRTLTKVTKKGFADVLKAMGAAPGQQKKKKSLWEMLTDAITGGGGSGGGLTIIPTKGRLLLSLLKFGAIAFGSNYLGNSIRSALGIKDHNTGERAAHFVGDTIVGEIAYHKGKAQMISTMTKLKKAYGIKRAASGVAKVGRLARLGTGALALGGGLIAGLATGGLWFLVGLAAQELVMRTVVDPLIHRYIRYQNREFEQKVFETYQQNNYSANVFDKKTIQDRLDAMTVVGMGGGTLNAFGNFHGRINSSGRVWIPKKGASPESVAEVERLNEQIKNTSNADEKEALIEKREKLHKKAFVHIDRQRAVDRIGQESLEALLEVDDSIIKPEALIAKGFKDLDSTAARNALETSSKTQKTLANIIHAAGGITNLMEYQSRTKNLDELDTDDAISLLAEMMPYNSYYDDSFTNTKDPYVNGRMKAILESEPKTLKEKAEKINALMASGRKEYQKIALKMMRGLSEADRRKVIGYNSKTNDMDYYKTITKDEKLLSNLEQELTNVKLRQGGWMADTRNKGSAFFGDVIKASADDDLSQYSLEAMKAKAENFVKEGEPEIGDAIVHHETTDLISAENQVALRLGELTSLLTGRELVTEDLSGNEKELSLSSASNDSPTKSGGPGAIKQYLSKLDNLHTNYGGKISELSQ